MSYYIVEKPEAIAAIDKWFAAKKEQTKVYKEVVSSIDGAAGGYLVDRGVAAVVFEENHKVDSSVWKKSRYSRGWIPKQNTKAGKEVSRLLRTIPSVDKEHAAINEAVEFPQFLESKGKLCLGPGICRLKDGSYCAHVGEEFMHEYTPPPFFREITHAEFKEREGH